MHFVEGKGPKPVDCPRAWFNFANWITHSGGESPRVPDVSGSTSANSVCPNYSQLPFRTHTAIHWHVPVSLAWPGPLRNSDLHSQCKHILIYLSAFLFHYVSLCVCFCMSYDSLFSILRGIRRVVERLRWHGCWQNRHMASDTEQQSEK